MNKCGVIITLLLSVLLVRTLGEDTAGAGQEVMVVQSLRIPPYAQVFNGFQSVCRAETDRWVASDLAEADLMRKIRTRHPGLVFAIGMDAFFKLSRIRHLPIVYAMVFDAGSGFSIQTNMTGVYMNIPQERQLTELLEVLPGIEQVGLVYDPVRTESLVDRAREASEKLGIHLICCKVDRAEEVPLRIGEMKGRIQVLWMLPDLTVVTPESVEYMLLFSLENRIPILTFSEKYVELGALMAVGIDPTDVGRQAGRMANEVLSGKPVQSVAPRKARVCFNLKVAKKLGITLNEPALKNVQVIH